MSFLLVSDIIKMAMKQMEDAGIENTKVEAEILYCFMKHIDRSKFFLKWSEEADDRTCEAFFDLVAERCKRVPLQHIIGTQDFMGLTFKVKPGVLIPRMDTEVATMAAELIIKEKKYKTCLDLCCGSGCIGIALAKRTGVKVTSVDLSKNAVELTAENAKANDVKLDIVQSDMFQGLKKKKYNMIISNPPYIKSDVIETLMPEVRDHDPREALDGGEDGLDFYRQIVEEAPQHLKKGGTLVLEIGHDQAYDVTTMLEESPAFGEIKLMKDLAQLDRVVTAEYVGK